MGEKSRGRMVDTANIAKITEGNLGNIGIGLTMASGRNIVALSSYCIIVNETGKQVAFIVLVREMERIPVEI